MADDVLQAVGGAKKATSGAKGNSEKLVVTVIPVNEEAYAKTIQIPHALIGR